MRISNTTIPGRLTPGSMVAATVAVAILLTAPGASSARPIGGRDRAGAVQAAALIKTAFNKSLHQRILVTRLGRSLYALSAEKRGRFICINRRCLSFWTPLLVADGQKPTGVRSLGTITRPGGQVQATYRGRPLYTFNDDRRPGQVGGEGFVDVGVWHAVVAGS
jgi:predicted lipoprotein with Yx(FWY)xxD motif